MRLEGLPTGTVGSVEGRKKQQRISSGTVKYGQINYDSGLYRETMPLGEDTRKLREK